METTKFLQLCSAFGHAQDSFDNYRKESHMLAVELVKQLKEYYQIPESQFSLFKIDVFINCITFCIVKLLKTVSKILTFEVNLLELLKYKRDIKDFKMILISFIKVRF